MTRYKRSAKDQSTIPCGSTSIESRSMFELCVRSLFHYSCPMDDLIPVKSLCRWLSLPGLSLVAFLVTGFHPMTAFAVSVTLDEVLTDHLLRPSGVAVASDGSIWVANQGSCYQNSLAGCSVSATLQYLSDSGNMTIKGFTSLSGVAVDSQGNAWVSDIGANKVYHVTTRGTIDIIILDPYLEVINAPMSVAVDSQDNLYVANRGDQAITKWNSKGTFITYWKVNLNLMYLAVDDKDRLWIADAQNDVIRCLACGTAFPVQSKSAPRALGFDQDGNIWVADYTYSRVTGFSPHGQPLGSVKVGVKFPTGIAFDPQGRLYVSNFTTNSVSVYSIQ
jgi:tripartite motif-containing protein 71